MDIEQNLAALEDRIRRAAERVGRKFSDVTLLAVSKRQPPEAMRELQRILAAQGRTPSFGENYVQEFKKKRAELTPPFEAHLIGALQRNKARDAVRSFDVIESVHDEKIAEALDEAARKEARVVPIFLQINISSDDAKAGISPDRAEQAAAFVVGSCKSLRLTGLMTITRLYAEPEDARGDFQKMRELRDALARKISPARTLKLSMGMSSDFEIAIEEGSDVVRIGTALFGSRE